MRIGFAVRYRSLSGGLRTRFRSALTRAFRLFLPSLIGATLPTPSPPAAATACLTRFSLPALSAVLSWAALVLIGPIPATLWTLIGRFLAPVTGTAIEVRFPLLEHILSTCWLDQTL